MQDPSQLEIERPKQLNFFSDIDGARQKRVEQVFQVLARADAVAGKVRADLCFERFWGFFVILDANRIDIPGSPLPLQADDGRRPVMPLIELGTSAERITTSHWWLWPEAWTPAAGSRFGSDITFSSMAAVCSPAFRRLCNSRLRSNAGAIRHLTAELTDHLAMCNTHLEDENSVLHTALEARRPGASAHATEDHDDHIQSFREPRLAR